MARRPTLDVTAANNIRNMRRVSAFSIATNQHDIIKEMFANKQSK